MSTGQPSGNQPMFATSLSTGSTVSLKTRTPLEKSIAARVAADKSRKDAKQERQTLESQVIQIGRRALVEDIQVKARNLVEFDEDIAILKVPAGQRNMGRTAKNKQSANKSRRIDEVYVAGLVEATCTGGGTPDLNKNLTEAKANLISQVPGGKQVLDQILAKVLEVVETKVAIQALKEKGPTAVRRAQAGSDKQRTPKQRALDRNIYLAALCELTQSQHETPELDKVLCGAKEKLEELKKLHPDKARSLQSRPQQKVGESNNQRGNSRFGSDRSRSRSASPGQGRKRTSRSPSEGTGPEPKRQAALTD